MRVLKFLGLLCACFGVGLGVLLALILLTSIGRPSVEDKVAMEKTMAKWGGKYEISFPLFDDLYVHLKLKQGAVLNREEIEQVYKDFFEVDENFESKRKSFYFYMNVYDNKGGFLYQICLSGKERKIAYGTSDAY